MATALILTSSAAGGASVSSELVRETVDLLKAEDPGLAVITRDLGADPLPHFDEAVLQAMGPDAPTSEAVKASRARADALITELKAADVIVMGAPMYNFGIPSTLKAWFDYVLRPGETFRYTEAGPEGLLAGKRAILVLTRGGFYSDGPLQALDAQEPHLKTMLNFIGIDDIAVVRAEKLAFGPEAREDAIGGAKAALRDVVGSAGSMVAA